LKQCESFITYAVACLSLRETELVWIWTWSKWRIISMLVKVERVVVMILRQL